MAEHHHHDVRIQYEPTPEEVTDLIERAKAHELGLGFLREGALQAVAAAFGVHAFTVDAARRRLGEEERAGG
jgi:hypothetical protein